MNHEFSIPERIISGQGAWKDITAYLHGYGMKALIVTGAHAVKDGTTEKLQERLATAGFSSAVYSGIIGEPTDKMVSEGLTAYQRERCDFLIAVGGGSPLDAMKAIAVMAVHPGELANYMGKEIEGPLPPMVAVPTTSGTGSEATQFTIITDTNRGIKMLLKGRALMPKLAVLDPSLSLSTPKSVTASTGLDALTHAIEAYTSKKAQPLSDTLALSAVKRIFANLPAAYQNGGDMNAREEMSIAALEAGMAFNNSSVTLVHGMSRPIGALFHVPHGISNAMLLGVCLRYALPGAYDRFAALGRVIGAATAETPDETAAQGFLQAVKALCSTCEIPTLAQYGIDKAAFFVQIDKMAADAVASGSPGNTRRMIDQSILANLYRELWEV